MPKYYMRVEAVNIANFVYDTHDISTIRGGSYLLLDSIESLGNKFNNRLTEITTAASQGLFCFEYAAPNAKKDSRVTISKIFENIPFLKRMFGRFTSISLDTDIHPCQKIKMDVLEYLQSETDGHATFLVAIQEEIPENFDQTLALLEAQIRRQQWRMPTIAVPNRGVAAKACYLDGWRPGVEKYQVDPNVDDAWVSTSTAFRRSKGRKIKHKLFYQFLGDEAYTGEISTKDLGELAMDPSKGVLNGKIAFIHVDGNMFGSIRRDLCKTEEDRKSFDKKIQDDFQNVFLKEIFNWAKSDPDFKTQGSDGRTALRLEVLLRGGDEMTLVVPAWQGWQVMRLFYNLARDLEFKGTPLTYRAAIIFCHHNAPILLIRQLAEDMLNLTKEDIGAGFDHASADALHYLVLESFDLLQGKLKDFLTEYYKDENYKKLLIYSHELDVILKSIHTIQSKTAHGKALKIIEALQNQNADAVKKIKKEMLDLLPAEERRCVEDSITVLTNRHYERWYLATDLWDYVPEAAI